MKIKNKYYVGSQSMRDEMNADHPQWSHQTLADALKHAEEVLDDNPDHDMEIVVQIIKVVRRKQTPVVVEDAK